MTPHHQQGNLLELSLFQDYKANKVAELGLNPIQLDIYFNFQLLGCNGFLKEGLV